MIKILVCLGTRPEAIKMSKIISELKAKKIFYVKVLSSGQHKEMVSDALRELKIKVDYDLKIMKIGQTLFGITADILNKSEAVIREFLPDIVLVHGDTSTAFALSLAAFYSKITVAHVESGLRSHDIYNPYPEEFNRAAIARIAKYHFAPTESAKENLVREGIDEENIFVTGNTVIDVLVDNIDEKYRNPNLPMGDFILLTAHRRESIPDGLSALFRAVARIAREFPKVEIVYPIHKNELIRKLAGEILFGMENVKIIEPLLPHDFHNFLYRCKFVITDSGGIQEESAYLGKPALVVRKCTERKELLSYSSIKLVGMGENDVFSEAKKLLENDEEYRKMSISTKLLGEGDASRKIVSELSKLLKK